MRFTLVQLLSFVTVICLLCGLAEYIPLPIAWGLAVMAMVAGFLSAALTGGSRTARWWRATLSAWLGLLLIAGVLLEQKASIFVVEVLWLTGLAALVIGTYVVMASGQPTTRLRSGTAAARAEMIKTLQARAGRSRGE